MKLRNVGNSSGFVMHFHSCQAAKHFFLHLVSDEPNRGQG